MLQRLLGLLGFTPPPPPPALPELEPIAAPGASFTPRFPLQRVLRAAPLSEAAAAFLVRRLCALAAVGAPLEDLGSPSVELGPGDVLVAGRHHHGWSRRSKGHFSSFSPESVRGLPSTVQSDVFLLGALLVECVTGRPPFKRDNDFATLEAVRLGALPPLNALSDELARIVERACQVDPDERWPDLAALAAALLPVQGDFGHAEWRALMLQHLPAPKVLPAEPPALVPLVDEPSRLVYADQLEETGRTLEARWLRLDCGVRAACGDEQLGLITQLRELTPQVDAAFLASVSRSLIDGCPVRLGFTCPLSWDRLRRTAQPQVRFCDGCHREVHFATSIDDAQHRIEQGHCVALSADLEPERDELRDRVYMGR